MNGPLLNRRATLRSAAAVTAGAALSSLASRASAEDEAPPVKRYLYISSPDAAQKSRGNGIYVFDIDDDHRFVRFIEVKAFAGGLRGFCPSLINHAAYYSKTGGTLGCFDLHDNRIVWEHNHKLGGDRACITQDGSTLYVPLGWWHRAADGGFLIVDARTGEVRERRIAGGSPHNSLISPDGQLMLIGGWEWLDVYDARDATLRQRFTDIGDGGVFPFTIDSRNHYAYICHHDHVGFDVVDLHAGIKLHRIKEGEPWTPRRTHGVGLTPDESEIWISDQAGRRLVVYDNTALPDAPPLKQSIKLSTGGHGWVCFSMDGRFGWCHTPDVIDVKTRQIVATLKDGDGRPVMGSKFFEAHFRDDRLVAVGDQFGLGLAHRPVAGAPDR